MPAPLKLMHVYQNSRVGGIQQQILGLIRAYDRTVVTPAFCSLMPLGEIGREIERLDVPVFSMNLAADARFSPATVLRLRSLLRREGIQVVRTHKYRANIHGIVAAHLARVPVVIASQHSDHRHDRKPTRQAINRLLLPSCDRVVAVSASIRDDLIEHLRLDPDHVLLMRNGVDTEIFSPAEFRPESRAGFGLGPDDLVVGFVGRLAAIKGLPSLLEAIRQLAPSYPAKLLVIGDGPQRQEYEDAARTLGISDRVIFTGERRDIATALSTMDVFCLPSLSEGLPNALLEAMAAAVPIVATSVGGVPDVIRDEDTGLLVEPHNPQALARSIERIFTGRTDAQAMGRRARALIVATRSIRAAARAWEALYVQAAADKLRDRRTT